MANRILGEYKDACSPPGFSPAPTPTTWQVPPSGFFKINVDGAASDDGRPSSIGVVIRDCQGFLIAASNKILPAPFSAEITEAMALQEGVLLASEMGLSHVIVESDALSIIQAIIASDLGGELGHIVQNIKGISSSFSWCSFQHLKRSGYRAAHEFARAARISGVSQVWKGVCPCFVKHVILEDGGL